MRILGVDPGSRLTGYGCIDQVGKNLRHVGHGTLRIANTSGKALVPLEDRLFRIYEGLSSVIEKFQPQMMVVERAIFAKNALSALKLGQARGAILLTGKIHSLSIFEYSPTEVKSVVAGHGQADKEQVAKMVQLIVGTQVFPTSDASDGLALAICHALMTSSHGLKGMRQKVDNSPPLQAMKNQRSKKRLSLAESIAHVVKKVESR